MNDFKLKSLKKPKGLKGLSGLGKAERAQPLPDLDSGPQRVASLVDDALANLTRALGDEQLAKRILKLQQKYPDASKLELVIMEWLDRKRVKYEFQKWLLGGRKLKGGQVVDFALDQGTGVIILEAQGGYWHTRKGSIAHDKAQKLALLGLSVWGKPVRKVIEVWESRIMIPNQARRDQTMQLALLGIEVGR